MKPAMPLVRFEQQDALGVRTTVDNPPLDSCTRLFETRDMRTGLTKVLGGGSKDIHTNTDFEGR